MGFIYMSYEDNQKVFGIGKTSDLKKRLKQFNTSKSITKIDFVCHFEFLTSEEHFVEKQIHKSLKQLGFKHPIVDGKEKKELFYFQHKIEDTVILIKNIINDLKINFVFNITKRFDFIVKYIDNKIHKPLTENGCQIIANKVEKKDNTIVLDFDFTDTSEYTQTSGNPNKYLFITIYIILSIVITINIPILIVGVLLSIPFVFRLAPELSEKEKQAILERQMKSLNSNTNNKSNVEKLELGKTSVKLGLNLLNLLILNK